MAIVNVTGGPWTSAVTGQVTARLSWSAATGFREEAWTCWVQGLSYYRQAINKENMAAAQLWWGKALALDPASAVLNAMLGFVHFVNARFGWSDDRDATFITSRAYADRALELDPNNAYAHPRPRLAVLARGAL